MRPHSFFPSLRIGDCEAAIKLWQEAPAEPAFQRQRLTGMVKARLLQAKQAAETGLTAAAKSKEQVNLNIEFQLPGNAETIAADTARALKKLKTAIQELIPDMEEASSPLK